MNTRITEDYVSFETTKLLKEMGFDLSEFFGVPKNLTPIQKIIKAVFKL